MSTEKVKALKEKALDAPEVVMNGEATGIIKQDDGWYAVKLVFDLKSGQAKIVHSQKEDNKNGAVTRSKIFTSEMSILD